MGRWWTLTQWEIQPKRRLYASQGYQYYWTKTTEKLFHTGISLIARLRREYRFSGKPIQGQSTDYTDFHRLKKQVNFQQYTSWVRRGNSACWWVKQSIYRMNTKWWLYIPASRGMKAHSCKQAYFKFILVKSVSLPHNTNRNQPIDSSCSHVLRFVFVHEQATT